MLKRLLILLFNYFTYYYYYYGFENNGVYFNNTFIKHEIKNKYNRMLINNLKS